MIPPEEDAEFAACMEEVLETYERPYTAERSSRPGRGYFSAMTRQCLSGRRIGDLETLQTEIASWSKDVNTRQRGFDWRMKIGDARRKLKSIYPKTLS